MHDIHHTNRDITQRVSTGFSILPIDSSGLVKKNCLSSIDMTRNTNDSRPEQLFNTSGCQRFFLLFRTGFSELIRTFLDEREVLDSYFSLGHALVSESSGSSAIIFNFNFIGIGIGIVVIFPLIIICFRSMFCIRFGSGGRTFLPRLANLSLNSSFPSTSVSPSYASRNLVVQTLLPFLSVFICWKKDNNSGRCS